MSQLFSRLYNRCIQPKMNKTTKIEKPQSSFKITEDIFGITEETLCIIDYKETSPFIPPIKGGQVVKIYDGDTITIAAKLPYPESPLYRFQVRLNGIDCPEIKSKTEDEKQIALLAKKEMERLTFQKVVHLKNVENEKYGRLLADVYVDDIHLNSHMLSNKFAVAYDGGTKQTPKSWVKFHFTGEM